MAPQEHVPPVASVLGTIGTVLWSIQLFPQIWQNWRTKDTEGLPAIMLMLWACATPPFGVYCVVQRFAIPLQLQPQMLGFLCLITWGQTMHYSHKWRPWTSILTTIGLIALFGGIEAALAFSIKGPYAKGVEWPMLLMGILGTILIAAGLLPPYPEMWKRKGRVVGISFIFLLTDLFGALFSLLALVTQLTFDPLGGTLYIVCIILEGGIFLSHGVWLIRTRKLRALAKAQGKALGDLPEAARFRPRKIGLAVAESSPTSEVA